MITSQSTVAVVAIRDDGRCVLYRQAEGQAAAEATVKALAKINLRTEIVSAIEPQTRPGTAIESTKRQHVRRAPPRQL